MLSKAALFIRTGLTFGNLKSKRYNIMSHIAKVSIKKFTNSSRTCFNFSREIEHPIWLNLIISKRVEWKGPEIDILGQFLTHSQFLKGPASISSFCQFFMCVVRRRRLGDGRFFPALK